MKIIVTGSAGQLASELMPQALGRGIDAIGFDAAALDISDLDAVNSIMQRASPDFVVNCAAYNDVDGAEENWKDAFMANAIGVKHLAKACAASGAVLVHFSSDHVFDGLSDRPYTVADVPDPVNAYGQSKLLGEEQIREHAGKYFLIRTSWLFGQGGNSFPALLMRWAAESRTVRVVDDQVASPTCAADLAGAVLDLMGTTGYGLYHITNSGECSKYEWAEHILGMLGWNGELRRAGTDDFPRPARRPAYSVLDNFPLQSAIGRSMPHWTDATVRYLKERV